MIGLKRKYTFVRSKIYEMASTFQRSQRFRKVTVNKTFKHVQEQKNVMSPQHSAYIPSSVTQWEDPYLLLLEISTWL